MKTRIVPAICVTLKPSYFILGCYLSVSMLSIIALLITNFTWLLKGLVVGIIIIASIYSVMQDVLLRFDWSWRTIEVTHQGKLKLTTNNNVTFELPLEASSVNHRLLTVLHFKRLPMRFAFRGVAVLSPWQVVDIQQYRKLRVWLKWGNPLKSNH